MTVENFEEIVDSESATFHELVLESRALLLYLQLLKNGYLVWLCDKNEPKQDFSNLVLSTKNKFVSASAPIATTILDKDLGGIEYSSTLGRFLTLKLGKPVFISTHLSQPLLATETVKLQKLIIEVIEEKQIN